MNEFIITEELEAKLAAAESLDEVVKACAEEGIEITLEQLEAAIAGITQDGELTEDTLDNVAGGASVASSLLFIISRIKLPIIIPGCPFPRPRPVFRWPNKK